MFEVYDIDHRPGPYSRPQFVSLLTVPPAKGAAERKARQSCDLSG